MPQSEPRTLDGDKARRIVEATREQVGLRGAAGATFEHVARAAGVSRGLLHYYFGTKERLLAEAVRRDCDVRLERMRAALAGACSAGQVAAALAGQFAAFVDEEREGNALLFELFAASRHHPEIGVEMGRLYAEVRAGLADLLAGKQAEGVVALAAAPATVASLLFALADGVALQILSDPAWDPAPAVTAGLGVVTLLLTGAPLPDLPTGA